MACGRGLRGGRRSCHSRAVLDDHIPFTRTEALLDGITDRQLAGPRFRKVLTGYYLPAEVAYHPVHATRAALLAHPDGAVASHFSVTRLIGAPVPDQPEEHVTVARAEDRRQRQGLRCHVGAVGRADIRLIDDVPVTGPERTFVDLTAHLTLVERVAFGDWLVRHDHTTPEVLLRYCRRARRRRVLDAIEAAAYVRPRVDSPQETRVRMLLVLAGLPEPEINQELHDGEGRFVARLDHSYQHAKLGVEYDGRHHLTDARQWERDVVRRARIEELGWRLIVVTAQQLHRHPDHVLDQVWRALRERSTSPVAAPCAAWRPHFPG